MVEVVRIPKLGLSERGDLTSWAVAIGDRVERGEVIATLESEKASAEIESPADGVLLETYVEEGETIDVEVGKPLGVVGEEGEAVPSLADLREETEDEGDEATETTSPEPTVADEPEVKATPRAKRLAQDEGVDLQAIEGTGPQGAVTTEDVERHEESASEPSSAAESAPGAGTDLTITERRELTGTRKTIAERLSRSAREKPHVMGTREIEIEALEDIRERLDERYDLDVSLNDLFLYFVARTLRDLPAFNAHFEDGEHRLVEEVNLGYAVDGPRGLVVPVIPNAAERSLASLARERRERVDRVLADEHVVEDLRGGTFTVTNVGVFGMDVSYSIVNPPEVAILAIGRRKYAPVERDGDVDVRKVITASLTIDHRVLDGADSGAFLERLAEYVEYPGGVLEEIDGR
ncbi:MAG: dihydrolipoamide acetyltransferase family protein [Halanaeroarchaeum sp.]